ncbi:glycoside hydrolase family 32 protein [Halalkalibacter flavus]|uniref:glycoside hydrolase family 32 protein n=1 Tax=Halalkalibacter flavus TaxID=3090668 RepID=UPI002FC820F4
MYNERYRPQFHFSPKENWMNDPNGLVYFEGEYHLFYQYHPDGTKWGPMHWGHAVSKDLIHWDHLPIALFPDELGTIFSGCAVVDYGNTSGLKDGDEDVMVAIFTQHEEGNQKQSIAYSHDRGRTWMKYQNNPVIANPGLKDIRDPKVFWHKDAKKWIMSLACGDHIRFYGSSNLLEWEHMSSFGEGYGAHGGVWECQDLIEVPVKGSEEKKWVLIVSINPGAPNGGSGMQYFVGEFDGETFHSDESPETTRWVDYGRDFYAAVSWLDTPTRERIWIGWMSNWQYANEVPTHPWRSAMSIPRVLTLTKTDSVYNLVQTPVKDIEQLRTRETIEEHDVIIHKEKPLKLSGVGPLLEMDIEVKEAQTDSWGIHVRHGESQTTIAFHLKEGQWFIDRTQSGEVDFSREFPSKDIAPFEKEVKKVQFYLDTSSLEVFLNDGESVMTELIFPSQEDVEMELFATNGEVVFENVKVTNLKGIWEKEREL